MIGGMPIKLEKALARIAAQDPFWGRLSQDIMWKKGKDHSFAMGVALSRRGFVGYYNGETIDKEEYTNEEIQEILKHEIWHIILRHPMRHNRNLPHLIQNIAMDMVVNGDKDDPRVKVPANSVWCPKDWVELNYEEVLKKLLDKACNSCPFLKGSGGDGGDDGDDGDNDGDDGDDGDDDGDDGDDDGSGGGGGLKPQCASCPFADAGGEFVIHDDHEFAREHGKDIDESEYRQILKQKLEEAAKTAGSAPGDIQEIIDELNESLINWRSLLPKMVHREIGGRRFTFKRRNRRLPRFGIKGQTKKSRARLYIWVDTSGSITIEILKQFFAEVEALSQYYKIVVIQWDVGITNVNDNYHRGDWRRISVYGRGGTDFEKTLQEAEEKELIGPCNVILSDMCFFSDIKERPYNFVWATTGSNPPPWAKNVIRIETK